MKVTTFQTVAEKLANTIGRERGVRVTFGGAGAWSCKGHVHLPALPAGTVLTPFEADLMRGYLDHEVGHVRRTDFSILGTNEKKFRAKPCVKYLWNVAEDVWSENKTLEEYTDRFLNTTHSFMDEKAVAEIAARKAAGEPLTMADLALRLTYRELWKKRGLDRDAGTDLTLEELGLGEVSELIEREFPRCRTSQDNLALAWKIYDLLEEAVDAFEPPPSPGEGEKGDEKNDGEGGAGGGGGESGDEEGDGEGGAGDGGEGGDEESNGEGGSAGEPGDGKRAGGYTNGRVDRNAKPTEAGDLNASSGKSEHQELLEEIVQRIVSKNAKDEKRGAKNIPRVTSVEQEYDPNNPGEYVEMEWKGDNYLPPAGTEHDRIFVPSGEDMATYRKERAALAGPVSSIKKALTIFLRSKEMKAWTRGLEEGRLDEEALADLCVTGNRRVFKQRRARTFPNTAFAVICDLSSSMSAPLVRQTATAFVEALAQLPRIKTLVAGFNTNNYRYKPTPGCGRNEGMDLLLFKGFDEPYRTAMPRLGAIGTDGCTPLGEGYAYGFEALVKRPERRKVLLVITDGMPCYDWGNRGNYVGADHNDFALISHVQKKCATYGIETLGIGIGYGGITNYVDYGTVINRPHQLARAVLEMTKRVVVPC